MLSLIHFGPANIHHSVNIIEHCGPEKKCSCCLFLYISLVQQMLRLFCLNEMYVQ